MADSEHGIDDVIEGIKNMEMADRLPGDVESSAISILKRAVELESSKRYDEAATCYQEGLQLLLDVHKGETDVTKKGRLRQKIEEYMGRAEELKKFVKEEKTGHLSKHR
ncbi:MIT domain-containing protein 1-like [Saccostrea cucullata]|uniref:MIT domain-containing protein 1-like n=1 Tax=Saccostrea cuccullata TaxID=36930 RepID=UPI002ED2A6A9